MKFHIFTYIRLPNLENTQHIAHDAKHAIRFILCKICNVFCAHNIDEKGGAAYRPPPLVVNKMCTKYIAYFAKYETYCMFCIMCNMLRILQNGQCNVYKYINFLMKKRKTCIFLFPGELGPHCIKNQKGLMRYPHII